MGSDIYVADSLSQRIFGHPLGWSEENPFYISLILENEKGNLLGFIMGQSIFENAELHYLGVDPNFLGKGYGTLLVKGFLEACRRQGAETVALEVRFSNGAAISLYEKTGFATVSLRKNYYPDREDALLMLYKFVS